MCTWSLSFIEDKVAVLDPHTGSPLYVGNEETATRLVDGLNKINAAYPAAIVNSILPPPPPKEIVEAVEEVPAPVGEDPISLMRELLEGLGGGFSQAEKGMSEISAFSTSVFHVTKEAGQHRWLLISSVNAKDKDGHIVSEKALQRAVLIGDTVNFRGPLRWWHTKKPPLDLGRCDFQMVHKGHLIEGGEFVSPEVGEAVARVADQLRVSIGFIHPKSEPDRDGVFHTIATFERSLLPAGREANPFTLLQVV
jgi:hypothetical protein